ncbi:MAG: amino acid-binding ACT domain protein [Candidatus Hodarchaeales archaeon]
MVILLSGLIAMWDIVERAFKGKFAQLIVVRAMLELGISVRDGHPCCGPFRIKKSEFAQKLGVNRKVVSTVIKQIEASPQLAEVFERLKPICDISEVAKILGFPVLEIFVENSFASGIVAKVTAMLAQENVTLRFVAALDPEISVLSKLVLVGEGPLPRGLADRLMELRGIEKIGLS